MYGLTWKLNAWLLPKDTPDYTLPIPASFLVVCSSGLSLLRPEIFSDYIPP